MLQDPQTGERHGFASLEHLVRHLNAQMSELEKPDRAFNSQTDPTLPENTAQDEQTRRAPDQAQAQEP